MVIFFLKSKDVNAFFLLQCPGYLGISIDGCRISPSGGKIFWFYLEYSKSRRGFVCLVYLFCFILSITSLRMWITLSFSKFHKHDNFQYTLGGVRCKSRVLRAFCNRIVNGLRFSIRLCIYQSQFVTKPMQFGFVKKPPLSFYQSLTIEIWYISD